MAPSDFHLAMTYINPKMLSGAAAHIYEDSKAQFLKQSVKSKVSFNVNKNNYP